MIEIRVPTSASTSAVVMAARPLPLRSPVCAIKLRRATILFSSLSVTPLRGFTVVIDAGEESLLADQGEELAYLCRRRAGFLPYLQLDHLPEPPPSLLIGLLDGQLLVYGQ
jgi:hypothetical protein